MQFRSSPILLVFCVCALLSVVVVWNVAPRIWGGTYRAVTSDTQTESAQKGASLGEHFRITDASPQSMSVLPNTQVTIQNELPQALAITFTREGKVLALRDRMTIMIATSSSSTLSFATSGVWKCESNIIRLCGSINVLETPTR